MMGVRHRDRRVHVIDDDPDARRLMRMACSAASDVTLRFTDNCSEALEAVAGWRHDGEADDRPPDLLVVDLDLGADRGESVVSAVRDRPTLAALPVVVFSSSVAPDTVTDCYRRGANGMVEKPVEPAAFQRRFHALVSYWLDTNAPRVPLLL